MSQTLYVRIDSNENFNEEGFKQRLKDVFADHRMEIEVIGRDPAVDNNDKITYFFTTDYDFHLENLYSSVHYETITNTVWPIIDWFTKECSMSLEIGVVNSYNKHE